MDEPKRSTQPKKRVSPESFLRVFPKPTAAVGPDGQPEFQIVPLIVSERDRALLPEKPWRVILSFVEDPTQHLALELHGDTVFGASEESDPDLDVNLASFKDNQRGVSQRHLKLRPGRDKLFVLDLGSTNGTYVNGTPLGKASAQALQDGDLITLGRLHLRVKIAQHP